MQYLKAFKPLLIIGLLPILLLIITMTSPFNFMQRLIVIFSKYRALLPYMVAQAKLETGNFRSRVFRENKNYFGMKMPKVRPTKAIGDGLLSPEGNYYANFRSEADSIADLLLWFDYTKFPTSVTDSSQYVSELKRRGYFGSSETAYLKNINFWLNNKV
jgi:hypothetical protein